MKKLLYTLAFVFSLYAPQVYAQVWQSHAQSYPSPFFGADVSTVNDNVAWTAAFNGDFSVSPWNYNFDAHHVARTTDGGLTWKTFEFPSSGAGIVANIVALDSSNAWVSFIDFSDGNKVFHTADGGQTWDNQPSGITVWVNFVHMWNQTLGLAMGDPDGAHFQIFTTILGGQFWTPVPESNIPDLLPGELGISDNYSVAGSSVYFGTSAGRIFYSSNKGFNWSAWDAPFSSYPDAVASADDGHVVVSYGDYSDTITHDFKCKLFRTNGDGAWADITPANSNYVVTGLQYIPGTATLVATFRRNNTTGPFETRVSYNHGDTWITIDETARVYKIDFKSTTTGFGSEYKNNTDPSIAYNYNGSPLTGLFNPQPIDIQISVSPNPTTDQISVEVHGTTTDSYSILVNDLSGRLIYKSGIENEIAFKQAIDLTAQPAGVYVVTLSSAKGVKTEKITKK